jgi:serine protease Do
VYTAPFQGARIVVLASLLASCSGQAGGGLRTPGAFGAGLASTTFVQVAGSCEPARDPLDLPEVVTRVRAAVVSVVAGKAADGAKLFSEHGASPREHALGSGMIIATDGLVLTSRHVIEDADAVRIDLDDGRSFAGKVVARDAFLDVALIRMTGARDLPVAVLGSSGGLRIGDPVIAMGSPFGLGPSVRRGILSAKERSVDEGPPTNFLQSDAAVNPGDSGGPLLDGLGRVVGVNTAVIEHGQGLSFAVPIDDVRAVLGEMLATGLVARGHAGISFQNVDAPVARALKLRAMTGAIVTDVDAGGPSARASVRPGDVITSLDGHPIANGTELSHELGLRKPGDVVRFGLLRAGQARTAMVLLDRLPNKDDTRLLLAEPAKKKGGAGLKMVDAEGGGAKVASLDPESTTADDLRPGDVVLEVDYVPVKSAAEVRRRLAEVKRPGSVLLRVRRSGAFLYVGIDLD